MQRASCLGVPPWLIRRSANKTLAIPSTGRIDDPRSQNGTLRKSALQDRTDSTIIMRVYMSPTHPSLQTVSQLIVLLMKRRDLNPVNFDAVQRPRTPWCRAPHTCTWSRSPKQQHQRRRLRHIYNATPGHTNPARRRCLRRIEVATRRSLNRVAHKPFFPIQAYATSATSAYLQTRL